VHLSLPTDCLEGRAKAASGESSIPSASLRHEDAMGFLEHLVHGASPLILAGPSLLTRAGRARLKLLEDALGIPVVGMESPRGVADPSLGAFAEVLALADRILLLGKRLDFTLKFGRSPALLANCEFIQVDPDAAEIDRTRAAVGSRLVASAVADPIPALDVLQRHATRVQGEWLDEVRDAVRYRPPAWNGATASEPGRLHPVQALRPLQSILDAHPESVFVSDGGEFGQWAQACLTASHRVINGVAGAIGPGIPFALAARVAKPAAPIIAAMGDGTFGFHAAEIDTAVRYGLPFLAIVGNDARWNAEYQIQLREYGASRAKGCELLPSRYDQVAAAFGAFGELVTQPADLMRAAQRAIDSGQPAVLNVMIEGAPAPMVRR
jgi:acetolactate synthase-1/2/3 large subunit